MTHTLPWPPPGAGAFVVALAFVPVAAVGVTAAPELFGLNKSPRLNLLGEGDGAGCVAGAGVAVAFLIARCFAGVCDGEGDSAGLGDCACETQVPANPTRAMTANIFVIISASVRRRRDYSQFNSGDTRNGRALHAISVPGLSGPVVCATL